MAPLYKENRIMPVGLMLFTLLCIFYYLDFDGGPARAKAAVEEPVTYFYSTSQELKKAAYEEQVEKAAYYESKAEVKESKAEAVKPVIPAAAKTSAKTKSSSSNRLATEDVALLFKTGASVLWKRLPIHLSTSLSPDRIDPNNTILYSDYPEKIGSWEIIDILANSSDYVRQSDSFQPYLQQEDHENRQIYAEQSGTEGDGNGPLGGWRLDKYKFLPLIQHAGIHKPDAKWYIYMEDDAYIFLPNLLRHLDEFDHTEPWYFGSLAWKHGDYFAHGGAGFALSRAGWEKSFGADPDIVEKFEKFTDVHGCGDHVLGHVLNEYGISFGEHHDSEDQFAWGFNVEPHWASWFTRANWCKPVYSWHHTHSKDVARFYNLEQSWDFEKNMLKYRDIYDALIAPYLRPRVDWWDNRSSKYSITSGNAPWAEMPKDVKSKEVWLKSWQSADACEAACKSWSECVQWSFYEDGCRVHDQVFLGSGYPVGDPRRQTSLPYTSGWLKERVDDWLC